MITITGKYNKANVMIDTIDETTRAQIQDITNHPALEYCVARKIDIAKYQFYATRQEQYNLHKRIIIPFIWQGRTIGYTARAVTDGVKPKYHSSYEPNYVFNINNQLPDSKFVIVCEGPFDAMSIDGVAVLNNECNETSPG